MVLKMVNNYDKAIIVLHEIYGINNHITGVCQQLFKSGYDVICPNLLKPEQPFNYSQGEKAYSFFKENIGFNLAARRVKDLIGKFRAKYRKLYLLGFSIGATTAWLCSGNEVKVDGVIGYYGSRIRDYLKIEPGCPALLIMANQEKSFEVAETLAQLQRKPKVEVHVLVGKHGFADPFSKNFDEVQYLLAKSLVDNFLEINNS